MPGVKIDTAWSVKASPARILACLLLLAACVAPASAAPEPDYSAAETRKMMYDFGLCAVEYQRTKASELILANLDNSALRPLAGSTRTIQCMAEAASDVVTMRFPGDMFRYALADALVAADFRAFVPMNLAAVRRLQHREVDESEYRPKLGKKASKRKLEELEERRAQAMAYAYFSHFGECVVRSDALKAHALLIAKPVTVEEARAFAALAPAFGNCLVAGKQFAANRMVMRGSIAINYYRLAMAARSAVGGASGDA